MWQVDIGSYPIMNNPDYQVVVSLESKDQYALQSALHQLRISLSRSIIFKVETDSSQVRYSRPGRENELQNQLRSTACIAKCAAAGQNLTQSEHDLEGRDWQVQALIWLQLLTSLAPLKTTVPSVECIVVSTSDVNVLLRNLCSPSVECIVVSTFDFSWLASLETTIDLRRVYRCLNFCPRLAGVSTNHNLISKECIVVSTSDLAWLACIAPILSFAHDQISVHAAVFVPDVALCPHFWMAFFGSY